jgi:hypothetical protein
MKIFYLHGSGERSLIYRCDEFPELLFKAKPVPVGKGRGCDLFQASHGLMRFKEKIQKVAGIHLLTKIMGAAGTIGNDFLQLSFSATFFGPALGQFLVEKADSSAFTATKCFFAMVFHLGYGGVTALQEFTHGAVNMWFKSNPARVMNGDGLGRVQGLRPEYFINGLHVEVRCIFFEHAIAVGTGHKDVVDRPCGKEVLDALKLLTEEGLITKVMGRLGAAVENHPDAWELDLQLGDHIKNSLGSRSRQGAAREKNNVATVGQPIP